MKPSRSKVPAAPPSRPQSPTSSSVSSVGAMSEEVAVFCRVRPVHTEENDQDLERCVEVLDDYKSIQLVAPGSIRAKIYSFKAVFDEESTQADVFTTCGIPLVKDVLAGGRNGLLMAYGVTGSGKTYTMQGTPTDGGIVSRTLDVIFNSIEDRLVARKFVIMPNRLNDFQIQSVVDATAMQQKEMMDQLKKGGGLTRGHYGTRSNTSDPNLSRRLPDDTKVEGIDKNCVYAVFISYYEIYNTYIYDLLEDARDLVTGKPKFTSKRVQTDAHGNKFVFGATEIEVRSAKDALEAFYRGQKRRRVAETTLNVESSRSHAIFNIRVVRAHPADDSGEIDNKPCLVTQLALVDLAGSEDPRKTGNTGGKLKEGGRINNSLRILRQCIERLRENQRTGKSGNIPYRDDTLTTLFRNFFEGIGSVKMMVCINPRAADISETERVLEFAEMAQEVEIERFDPRVRDFAMTASRARVEEAFQDALNREATDVDITKMNPDFSPIYSLGPAWPSIDFDLLEDEDSLPALMRYLEQRIATRNTLVADHKERLELFRQRLVEIEKDNIVMKEENQRIKAGWETDKRRIRDLESRLVNAEAANTSLQRRVDAFCEAKVVMEKELDDKEIALNQQKREAKRVVKKLQTQLSHERDSRKRSFEEKEEFRGVGSRIAEMEAKCGESKKHKY